jgi:hypothetical protein
MHNKHSTATGTSTFPVCPRSRLLGTRPVPVPTDERSVASDTTRPHAPKPQQSPWRHRHKSSPSLPCRVTHSLVYIPWHLANFPVSRANLASRNGPESRRSETCNIDVDAVSSSITTHRSERRNVLGKRSETAMIRTPVGNRPCDTLSQSWVKTGFVDCRALAIR